MNIFSKYILKARRILTIEAKTSSSQFTVDKAAPQVLLPLLAHDTSIHIFENDSHFANVLKAFISWNGVNIEIMITF